MTTPEHFHFLRPAWLLLVPVVVCIWWLVHVRQDPLRGWRTWMDHELLAALTVGPNATASADTIKRSVWNSVLSYVTCREAGFLAAWLSGVVAVAGPTWRPEASPFADDPVPVMLVLYAGESMELADLAPSRMERARLKIADFAVERKGQPLGLIAYSGSAHLVLPPTRDTPVVAAMAAEIGPGVMPRPGDELPAALRLAARTLGKSGGSIVVLADGAPSENKSVWREFRNETPWPVHFLAVARSDTPEWDTLKEAATELRASITQLTPDSTDVLSLVRRTAKAPVSVAEAGEGFQWAEAGWWLVPFLALLYLESFRRERNVDTEQTTLGSTALSDRTHKDTRGDT